MIKALFFDIDGTLVSFNTHEIPSSTLAAIAEAKAKGIKIFIATESDYQQPHRPPGTGTDRRLHHHERRVLFRWR